VRLSSKQSTELLLTLSWRRSTKALLEAETRTVNKSPRLESSIYSDSRLLKSIALNKSVSTIPTSDFDLLLDINRFVRSEDRGGRGTVATKSVSSQFSSQLRILRSRIEKTVPHYIRCLKPNDELVPDYFEPKNIIEQLRCGGVLEAVRVSRAGYPTRYPHDVFMARCYILGDPVDKTPQSPLFTSSIASAHDADKQKELKRLISKIAYDLWQIDHEVLQAQLKVEKPRRDSLGVVHQLCCCGDPPLRPQQDLRGCSRSSILACYREFCNDP
jgi:hypothetical protein